MIAPVSSDQENDLVREDNVVSTYPSETTHLAAVEFDMDMLSSDFMTKVQLAIALDADLSEDQRNCCLGSNPHRYHVLLLRIAGGLCIVFGSISIGIGSHLRAFFSNFIAGPWWISLPVIVAGISALCSTTSLKLFMTSCLSIIGTIVAVIGLYNDGLSLKIIRSISSCGSQSSATSNIKYYAYRGNAGSFQVDDCIWLAKSAGTYRYKSCYCANTEGTYCGAIMPLKDTDCGALFTTYQAYLVKCTAITAVVVFCSSVLVLLGYTVAACPGRLGGIRHALAHETPAPSVGDSALVRTRSEEV